jgi:hypothetical protein
MFIRSLVMAQSFSVRPDLRSFLLSAAVGPVVMEMVAVEALVGCLRSLRHISALELQL